MGEEESKSPQDRSSPPQSGAEPGSTAQSKAKNEKRPPALLRKAVRFSFLVLLQQVVEWLFETILDGTHDW